MAVAGEFIAPPFPDRTASTLQDGKAPYPVRVSENHRFLIDGDGKPFFYLGDTAWELFHRLDRAEADLYLRDRAAKRFTVIQAVVLAEFGGLVEPNAYGHLPLADKDPKRPVEAYFEHVDFIVNRAEELRAGRRGYSLPTWGDKWNKKWGQGPEIFTPENAHAFGKFLGRRYRDKPIIWILGGDRPVENERQGKIIRAMADGLGEGDGGRHLMTYHPMGGKSSADFFPDDPWLAFHMLQSGHNYDNPNYDRIAADYARKPIKPCLDGEPGYEDHPAGFKAANGYLDDYDARKAAYWALFAGACGHTYGCHDIWQFLGPGHPPVTAARTPWREAKSDLPAAGQMRHVRALLESRPVARPACRTSRWLEVRPRSRHRPCSGDSGRGRELCLHLFGIRQTIHGGPGEALGGSPAGVLVRPPAGSVGDNRRPAPSGKSRVPAPVPGEGQRLGSRRGRRGDGPWPRTGQAGVGAFQELENSWLGGGLPSWSGTGDGQSIQ